MALELADAASATPNAVTDELYRRAAEHYDEAALVELVYIIATENLTSRFNRTFRVEPQGFYCVLPNR